jgi:uncharacterized protein (TIGR02001 family)
MQQSPFHNDNKDHAMHPISKPIVLAAAVAACLAAGAARAQAPEHSFTGRVAGYSEYEYRGISQTSGKPAAQLNLDYAHRSGFYAGTFVSNIRWLKDTAEQNGFSSDADIEWDLYGGFRFPVGKELSFDVGFLRYEYPSSGSFEPKPNTNEVYAGATYGPATLKYSYSIDNTFGVPDSKGSDYLELAVNYPLAMMRKVTLNAVVGHQRYKRSSLLDYTVWKAGATYDFGRGLTAGVYYKGTDAERAPYTVKGKDWSGDRAVAFVAYSF